MSAARVAKILILIAGVGLILYAAPRALTAFSSYASDGKMDWLAARAWRDGFNPYSTEGFNRLGHPALGMGHPPTSGFWFLPLASLDLRRMAQVVDAITLALLLVHLLLVTRELRIWPSLSLLAFGLVLATSWMRYHLELAQTSELIAFLLVVAWVALRHGRETLAGVLLGLACTIKPFPGVMVLMLLGYRRWRGVMAALAAWGAVAVVMTWRFGLASWPQFFGMQKPITDMWMSNLANGALQGIVLRMMSPGCNVVHPPFMRATEIAIGLSLLLLLAAFLLGRRSLDLSFALFSVLAYFVSPWFWEHYNVFLLLPFFVAAKTVYQRAGAARILGALTLLAVLLLCAIDREAKWHARSDYLHHTGPHWWVHALEIANWLPAALMLALLYALLWTCPRDDPHRGWSYAPST